VSEARVSRRGSPAHPLRRDPLMWAAPGLLLAALLVVLVMLWWGHRATPAVSPPPPRAPAPQLEGDQRPASEHLVPSDAQPPPAAEQPAPAKAAVVPSGGDLLSLLAAAQNGDAEAACAAARAAWPARTMRMGRGDGPQHSPAERALCADRWRRHLVDAERQAATSIARLIQYRTADRGLSPRRHRSRLAAG
jgi:hypothetical protein